MNKTLSRRSTILERDKKYFISHEYNFWLCLITNSITQFFTLKITSFHLLFQLVQEKLLGFGYSWNNAQHNSKNLMFNVQKKEKKIYYQPVKLCKNALRNIPWSGIKYWSQQDVWFHITELRNKENMLPQSQQNPAK